MRLFEEEDSLPGLVDEAERRQIRKAAGQWAAAMGKINENHELHRRLSWRPHLYCSKQRTAIHLMLYAGVAEVTVAGSIRARRLVPGLTVFWAGPDRYLRGPGVLAAAAEAQCGLVFLPSDGPGKVARYDSVLEAVFREGLILEPALYQKLARTAFDAVVIAPRRLKGRLLEHLLGLVISQVPGFHVAATNYNTATEEIDIVVENRRIGGIFRDRGAPLLLAESKNWTGKAGKNEYVSFASKIRNRRKSVSVGLFLSLGGYTQDFRLESLRDSRESFVIARFERAELEAWISRCGEDAAVLVEDRIRAALLE